MAPLDIVVLAPAHRPLSELAKAFVTRLDRELERIRQAVTDQRPALLDRD